MKKDVTLYNILFPIWFLLIFPITWIVILPANFLIDSLVLLVSIKLLKLANLKSIYKRTILKVWLIGFASDFIGAGILFFSTESPFGWDEYLQSVSWNPFDNWYALLYVAFAVIVTGLLIYIANLKFSFQNLEIEKRQKRILALALAVFTAPYVFFYPSSLINGGSFDELDFFTNHIVRRDEFRLEVVINENPLESHAEKPIIMYYFQNDVKDAINEADKISGEKPINTEPIYTLNFYKRDYTERKAIPMWIDGNQGYIQYGNAWYELDQKKIRPFIKAMKDLQNAKGKREFTIIPEPNSVEITEERLNELDKDGKKVSEYPVFEDSRYEYYCSDKEKLLDSAMIAFEDEEKTDIYKALESGLVTPQELIDQGLPLVAKPKIKQ